MIIKLAIIILSSFSAVSWSIGIANDSKVSQVRVDKSGKGIVTFDKALVATPPACGSEYKYSLAFDTNTAGGRRTNNGTPMLFYPCCFTLKQ